jgi:hypothetical protein
MMRRFGEIIYPNLSQIGIETRNIIYPNLSQIGIETRNKITPIPHRLG